MEATGRPFLLVLRGYLETVEVQPPRLVNIARLLQERALLVAVGRHRLHHFLVAGRVREKALGQRSRAG